jgi:hypothetical protein
VYNLLISVDTDIVDFDSIFDAEFKSVELNKEDLFNRLISMFENAILLTADFYSKYLIYRHTKIIITKNIQKNENALAAIDEELSKQIDGYCLLIRYEYIKEHFLHCKQELEKNSRLYFTLAHEWMHILDTNNTASYFNHINQSYTQYKNYGFENKYKNIDYVFYLLSQLRAEGIATLYEDLLGSSRRTLYKDNTAFEKNCIIQFQHIVRMYLTDDNKYHKYFNTLSYYNGKYILLKFLNFYHSKNEVGEIAGSILSTFNFHSISSQQHAIIIEAVLKITPEQFFNFILFDFSFENPEYKELYLLNLLASKTHFFDARKIAVFSNVINASKANDYELWRKGMLQLVSINKESLDFDANMQLLNNNELIPKYIKELVDKLYSNYVAKKNANAIFGLCFLFSLEKVIPEHYPFIAYYDQKLILESALYFLETK